MRDPDLRFGIGLPRRGLSVETGGCAQPPQYELPGAIEPTTPIGTKVVFERWENGKGESFFKVELIYQSVEQLRSIRPLSLDTPPMIVPISFAGVEVNEDGLIAEKDLMALLREKIDALDKIVDEYTEEELVDVA